MENSKYPERLLLMLKLNFFFRVKDCDYIQEHEVTGEVLHLPQSKRAEINDFKEIFEREFENSNLEDNRENRKYWTGILIDDIQAKKELYIELTKDNPKIGRSHGTILMAESFIKYLKKFAAPELKVKPEFTMNEIALRYYYEENPITKENSTGIAKQFGHNSGQKLYTYYNSYMSNADRKGEPFPYYTRKKMINKIKLFEKVISVLPEKFKQKALTELDILNTIKDTNDHK